MASTPGMPGQISDGDVTQLPVDNLEPHPLNDEIYTNRDIDELAEKIETYGFKDEHRLLVTPNGKILSGHRRWRAAKEVGLDTVPVEVTTVESEDDALLQILLANKYREKTPAEKINEGEAWERIEKNKAKERQGTRTDIPQNFAEGSKGDRRDKVGEKVGLSGYSYEKGKKVKQKAEEGDGEAKEAWEGLQNGQESIHSAHERVENPDRPDMKTYQFEVRSGLWESWVDTVPRNEPLDSRLRTLIRQDARAANADPDDATASMLAARIRRRAITALGAMRDDGDRERAVEELEQITDLAGNLE